ncbi:hypothetical protein JCM3766R1_004927 [Sporobolomyces carnicolor]
METPKPISRSIPFVLAPSSRSTSPSTNTRFSHLVSTHARRIHPASTSSSYGLDHVHSWNRGFARLESTLVKGLVVARHEEGPSRSNNNDERGIPIDMRQFNEWNKVLSYDDEEEEDESITTITRPPPLSFLPTLGFSSTKPQTDQNRHHHDATKKQKKKKKKKKRIDESGGGSPCRHRSRSPRPPSHVVTINVRDDDDDRRSVPREKERTGKVKEQVLFEMGHSSQVDLLRDDNSTRTIDTSHEKSKGRVSSSSPPLPPFDASISRNWSGFNSTPLHHNT